MRRDNVLHPGHPSLGKRFLRASLLWLLVPLAACQPVEITARENARRSLFDEKNFVKLPPGAFWMGAPGRVPPHRIALTRELELGRYEVTQKQWEAVMESNPSAFKGPDLPVTNVSWKDVQEFLAGVNKLDARFLYRLPTEAEWEYACRAGRAAMESPMEATDEAELRRTTWYEGNSLNRPHAVGQLQPNAWGFFDLLGNVAEWVQDWYDPEFYKHSPAEDPQGPPTGQNRVHRGCNWQASAEECRATARASSHPGERNNLTGFRLARTPR